MVKLAVTPQFVDPATSPTFQRLGPRVVMAMVTADPDVVKFTDTAMYIKYYPVADELYGSITRPQWTGKQVALARLYAQASIDYPKIVGIFLDDLVDQLNRGQMTVQMVHDIIATAKSINPALKIQATYYPHAEEDPNKIKQFNLDEIWFACNSPTVAANLPTMLSDAYASFPGMRIWGGVNPRADFAPHLNDAEWRSTLEYYRDEWAAGRIEGLSMYSAKILDATPQLIDIAAEVFAAEPTPIFPVWNTLALASGSAPLIVVVGTVIYEELVKLGVL